MEEKGQQPPIHIEKLYRNILTDKPRITRFDIDWFNNQNDNNNNFINNNSDHY